MFPIEDGDVERLPVIEVTYSKPWIPSRDRQVYNVTTTPSVPVGSSPSDRVDAPSVPVGSAPSAQVDAPSTQVDAPSVPVGSDPSAQVDSPFVPVDYDPPTQVDAVPPAQVDSTPAVPVNSATSAQVNAVLPVQVDDIPPVHVDNVPPVQLDAVLPVQVDTIPPVQVDSALSAPVDDVPPVQVNAVPPVQVNAVPPVPVDDIPTVHIDSALSVQADTVPSVQVDPVPSVQVPPVQVHSVTYQVDSVPPQVESVLSQVESVQLVQVASAPVTPAQADPVSTPEPVDSVPVKPPAAAKLTQQQGSNPVPSNDIDCSGDLDTSDDGSVGTIPLLLPGIQHRECDDSSSDMSLNNSNYSNWETINDGPTTVAYSNNLVTDSSACSFDRESKIAIKIGYSQSKLPTRTRIPSTEDGTLVPRKIWRTFRKHIPLSLTSTLGLDSTCETTSIQLISIPAEIVFPLCIQPPSTSASDVLIIDKDPPLSIDHSADVVLTVDDILGSKPYEELVGRHVKRTPTEEINKDIADLKEAYATNPVLDPEQFDIDLWNIWFSSHVELDETEQTMPPLLMSQND